MTWVKIKQKKEIYLNIKVKKNIPYGAGLGGASADAAALIRALKKLGLLKKNISNKKFSKIGADIPMCLLSKDCIASGIGERIKIVKKIPRYYYILVKPNINVSSKFVYSRFNRKINNQRKLYYFSTYKINSMQNDLEKIVSKKYPVVKNILKELSKLEDVNLARMTGSGSCCYAAFTNYSKAKIAYKSLMNKYPKYWICFTESLN